MKYRSFQTRIISESTGKQAIFNSYGTRIMTVPLGWTDAQIMSAIDDMLTARRRLVARQP